MAARIDKNVITAMANTGFTRKQIAERLGCSERQVRRILGTANSRAVIPAADTEDHLRNFYLAFETAPAVASRFAVSRQAIYQNKK